ncbi:uncharacterized protein ACMZJ9_010069 [Mantella aurantiaca]
MDEVWILSLCLTFFAIFLFILTLKPKQPEPESISKKSAPSTSYYASSGGRSLEIEEDDVEKMMERLNKLLYQDEPRKKEVPQERRKPVVQEKAPESPLHIKDSESTPETQEPVGKGPEHTQPAYQPSHHRVQEKSVAPAVENIMDEIEQAVQETVELDYYARRRQERAAARSRHIQGPYTMLPVPGSVERIMEHETTGMSKGSRLLRWAVMVVTLMSQVCYQGDVAVDTPAEEGDR